jgi:DNA-binding MarR family transcriptional regulator
MHINSHPRAANLLGAAALSLTDLMMSETTGTAGVSASGAAALVILSTVPGLTVTELGRRVGLSQSASARMVDSLEAAGHVTRSPGPGRWVTVQLTVLTGVLGALDKDEQEELALLLARLLTRLHDEIRSSEVICRLCDRAACTAGAVCPVGQAERDRQS